MNLKLSGLGVGVGDGVVGYKLNNYWVIYYRFVINVLFIKIIILIKNKFI